MRVLEQFSLDGKVALVTGANRGLGAAMARGLAEAGADLIGLNRADSPGSIAEEVGLLGRRFHHIRVDLAEASPRELEKLVEDAVQTMGRIDILVNNAGIIRRSPAIEYTHHDWEAVMQVNVQAAFMLAQAVGRLMIDQGSGKIIQVASVLGFQGGIFVPAYAAAKHALLGVTKALANEWAGLGVNVNAIAPGYFATDNTAPIRSDEARARALLDRVPANRWGQPDDLKGAVVFLASPASDFVHGATLVIDGGWLAR